MYLLVKVKKVYKNNKTRDHQSINIGTSFIGCLTLHVPKRVKVVHTINMKSTNKIKRNEMKSS